MPKNIGMAIEPESEAARNGWQSMLDPNHGKHYYYQVSNPAKTTAWELPASAGARTTVSELSRTDSLIQDLGRVEVDSLKAQNRELEMQIERSRTDVPIMLEDGWAQMARLRAELEHIKASSTAGPNNNNTVGHPWLLFKQPVEADQLQDCTDLRVWQITQTRFTAQFVAGSRDAQKCPDPAGSTRRKFRFVTVLHRLLRLTFWWPGIPDEDVHAEMARMLLKLDKLHSQEQATHAPELQERAIGAANRGAAWRATRATLPGPSQGPPITPNVPKLAKSFEFLFKLEFTNDDCPVIDALQDGQLEPHCSQGKWKDQVSAHLDLSCRR